MVPHYAYARSDKKDQPRVGIAARLLTLRPSMKPFEMKTLLYWLFKTTLLVW